MRSWLAKQAPDDWVILNNVSWSLCNAHDFVREGEGDFVVLVPGSGLLVIEVKGSKEFKVDDSGDWYRLEGSNWLKLNRPPPTQASTAMHIIVEEVSKCFPRKQFPGRYGYLVVYPNGEAASLPTMHDESTLATRRHRNQIASRIRHALEKRGPDALGREFDSDAIRAVVRHLKDTCFHVTKVDSGEDAAEDAKKIESLTRQQAASLRGLFQIPNVAVLGPAGSGKTLLALWRLQSLVAEGKRAAFVCYNRALADVLRLRNPNIADSIWNVDRLFRSFVPTDGSQVQGDMTEYFREQLPGLVDDRGASLPKYDAVIVDEGQDFSESQIIALFGLVADDGCWTFFADWDQDLYKAGTAKPLGAEVVFHLFHNCRNTLKINDANNRLLSMGVEPMHGLPEGTSPLIESPRHMANRAWELASQWSGDGSIVILSPFRLENSSMNGHLSGHGLKLTTNIAELGSKGMVYFSTIKAFKGIEAACVIVVDTDLPDATRALGREDLYVACTRATSRLALLVRSEEVASQYRAYAIR